MHNCIWTSTNCCYTQCLRNLRNAQLYLQLLYTGRAGMTGSASMLSKDKRLAWSGAWLFCSLAYVFIVAITREDRKRGRECSSGEGHTRRVRQGPRVARAPESRATYAPGSSNRVKAPTCCTPTPSDAAATACPACRAGYIH